MDYIYIYTLIYIRLLLLVLCCVNRSGNEKSPRCGIKEEEKESDEENVYSFKNTVETNNIEGNTNIGIK